MASEAGRQRILEALGRLLRPVVRVLLRGGVTWRDFSELGKATFVRIATEDFGIRGRPTNLSRVAILTGLDRREVARIRRTSDEATSPSTAFMSKPTQVLEGWFHDPDFRDPAGGPRHLDIDGEALSFADLVRRYAPGLPVVAMIKELRAAGAIEQTPTGQLRALKRAYIPSELSENQVRLWGSELEALGTTLAHNLARRDGESPRFQRRALSLSVDPGSIPAFQSFLEREGQAFLERVDDWLASHQATEGNGVRLGVGMYHIGDSATRPSERRKPLT